MTLGGTIFYGAAALACQICGTTGTAFACGQPQAGLVNYVVCLGVPNCNDVYDSLTCDYDNPQELLAIACLDGCHGGYQTNYFNQCATADSCAN
jgi:hypothetical protein